MRVVSITGHRPDSIAPTDYTMSNGTWQWIKEELKVGFEELAADRIITGMALGIDLAAAEMAYALHIPYIAAVPFAGQEKRWPMTSQMHYQTVLSRATDVVIVSPGGYAPWKMQVRNKWMVDHSGATIAVWDGTSGGTGNCVDYARRVGQPIYRINPDTKRVDKLHLVE